MLPLSWPQFFFQRVTRSPRYLLKTSWPKSDRCSVWPASPWLPLWHHLLLEVATFSLPPVPWVLNSLPFPLSAWPVEEDPVCIYPWNWSPTNTAKSFFEWNSPLPLKGKHSSEVETSGTYPGVTGDFHNLLPYADGHSRKAHAPWTSFQKRSTAKLRCNIYFAGFPQDGGEQELLWFSLPPLWEGYTPT